MSEETLAPAARDALRLLLEGHERFLGGVQRPRGMAGGAEWRRAMEAQQPVAVLITCADARISPHLVFDQDPGRIFIVRVAGPVASTEVLGSTEFAVERLGVPLVVVMTHSRCGAVAAARSWVRAQATGEDLVATRNLAELVEQVAVAPEDVDGDEEVEDLRLSEEENARRVAAGLVARSLTLQGAVEADTLGIVAARLDLDTGRVAILA